MSFVKLQDGRGTYALDSIRLRNQQEASSAPQANTLELYMKNGDLYQMNEQGIERLVTGDFSTTIPDRSLAGIKLQLNTVTSAEIANNTITNAQIANSTITAAQIANSTIAIANLAAEVLALVTPVGSILPYGGTLSPGGWLLCQGQSLRQDEYPALYSIVAQSFGNGSTGTVVGTPGGSRFNIPDLRGRFLRGVDGSTARDPDRASRTASATGGNTGDAVGSLQDSAVLEHQHKFHTAQDDGANFTGIPYDTNFGFIRDNGGEYVWQSRNESGKTGVGAVVGTATSESRPKNIYVNYIIKL